MTEKEKAEELVNKYKNISIAFVDSIEGTCDMYINNEDAKECALIAVNELIKETGSKYWYNVKQELEKL